nr:hypothetical protein [Kocuria sp.]
MPRLVSILVGVGGESSIRDAPPRHVQACVGFRFVDVMHCQPIPGSVRERHRIQESGIGAQASRVPILNVKRDAHSLSRTTHKGLDRRLWTERPPTEQLRDLACTIDEEPPDESLMNEDVPPRDLGIQQRTVVAVLRS